MSGGFKKNIRIRAPDIIGTRISVENAQLLVSTGAPDFDSVIGGGLPIGTLLLLDEDKSNSYSNLLAKLFLAEGVAIGHPLFIASKNQDIQKLVESLPPDISASDDSKAPQNVQQQEGSDLKIAWRYQHLPTAGQDNSKPLQFGHHFNLSQTLTPDTVSALQISSWEGGDIPENSSAEGLPGELRSLFSSIKETLTKHSCWVQSGASEQPKQRTVLRLAILSFGSPFWKIEQSHIPAFIYSLRALLRSACAVAFVSMPLHILKPAVASRCRQMSDFCIHPQPAVHIEGKVNPLLAGHNGVFKIQKLPVINSVAPFKPETFDLGFKVRRKKFCIEKLHLPPELADSEEREQDDVVGPKMMTDFGGCGSATNKKLDF